MSKYTTLYGYIALPSQITHQNFELVRTMNAKQLELLPLTDEFPPLTREMFSVTTSKPLSTFFEIMHFGGSIKNFDHEEIPEWLTKFENFLRKLIWLQAKVHLDVDIDGKFLYMWNASGEALKNSRSETPEPVKQWQFEFDESDAGFKIFDQLENV